MPLSLPGDYEGVNLDLPTIFPAYETTTVGGVTTTSGTVNRITEDRVFRLLDNYSPWVGGKLSLRENAFSRFRRKKTSWIYSRRYTYRTTSSTPSYVVKTQVNRQALNINESMFDQTAVDEIRALVLNRARAKFDENLMNANANLGIIFGERKKTIQTIAHRVLSMGFGLEAAARKARKLPRANDRVFYRGKPMSQLSRYWLEFWFGWWPVIKDIANLLNHQPTPETKQVTGRWAQSHTESRVIAGLRVDFSVKVVVKMKASMTVTSPALRTLNEFGLLNPLAVGWELISYSWLIDYFFNIGKWLTGLTAHVGLDVSDTSVTISTEHKVTHIVAQPPTSHGTYEAMSYIDSPGEFHRFSKVRSGILTEIQPLAFTDDLSLKQLQNTLALLFVKLRRI